ncbi:hypothetical protein HG536_0D01080 [Torulaspora globosa]|uniref:Uncharacterized protein n=1 Tax=Torulaspora globosa TaxID=48254 RepID=A0A7G3ZGF0_9SACH|nr:uncharacterized protein HG536_0D01080 [Torulaspora globosa]QLL32586.1 hypothetical protein HG536_0D01080 [Torulaspora globosa]
MSKFKIKRPHSPDHIGICNYKKQRLLYDLESLNLNDDKSLQMEQRWRNHQRYVENNEIYSDSVDEMYLPYTSSSHPLKVLQSDHAISWETDLLYSRLRKSARDARLQVVKWEDMKKLAYTQWLEWIRKRFTEKDFDYDMDNNDDYPGVIIDGDAHEDVDMDVDMDAF